MLQAVVDGVLTGSVYALMAAGLTLIFGVMDIINVAQGILVILGAYLSYELQRTWDRPVPRPARSRSPPCSWWGRVSSGPSSGGWASGADGDVDPGDLCGGARHRGDASFGVDYVQLNACYVNRSFKFFGFYLPYIYVYGFFLAVGAARGAVHDALPDPVRSSVRASVQDPSAASLVGIDVPRVSTICFGSGWPSRRPAG